MYAGWRRVKGDSLHRHLYTVITSTENKEVVHNQPENGLKMFFRRRFGGADGHNTTVSPSGKVLSLVWLLFLSYQ